MLLVPHNSLHLILSSVAAQPKIVFFTQLLSLRDENAPQAFLSLYSVIYAVSLDSAAVTSALSDSEALLELSDSSLM